jgi:hypothetical protein
MVGDGNTCTSVAQELAYQAGLEGELFEEMATYAANNSLDFQSMATASAAEVASTAQPMRRKAGEQTHTGSQHRISPSN